MTRALVRRAPAPPKLADLPPEVRAKARVKAVENRLVAEADREITAETTDLGELIADFLATRKSAQTARRYANGIRKWLAWCEGMGIEHPLLAETKDADLFAAQLVGAAASVNSTISAVSSLYSTLVKWGKIGRTPFLKIARRSDAAGEKMIPTAKEVKAILEAIG